MRNEAAQFIAAIVLLAFTAVCYAGMLHHERQLDEELRAAGVNIEELIRGK